MDIPELTERALKLAEGQVVQAVAYVPGHAESAMFSEIANHFGERGWFNAYTVVFHPGKGVTSHDHDEDVVLFYPEGTKGSPCVVYEGGERIETHLEPGEFLFVPKKTHHEVPPNPGDTPRVSIAVKLTDKE